MDSLDAFHFLYLNQCLNEGSMVKLVITPDFESGILGSSPGGTYRSHSSVGLERSAVNRKVAGSIPAGTVIVPIVFCVVL